MGERENETISKQHEQWVLSSKRYKGILGNDKLLVNHSPRSPEAKFKKNYSQCTSQHGKWLTIRWCGTSSNVETCLDKISFLMFDRRIITAWEEWKHCKMQFHKNHVINLMWKKKTRKRNFFLMVFVFVCMCERGIEGGQIQFTIDYLPKSIWICNALDFNIITGWPSNSNIFNSKRIYTEKWLQVSYE